MLTVNRTDKWHPRFSPDGSKISFGAEPNIYVMPVTAVRMYATTSLRSRRKDS